MTIANCTIATFISLEMDSETLPPESKEEFYAWRLVLEHQTLAEFDARLEPDFLLFVHLNQLKN